MRLVKLRINLIRILPVLLPCLMIFVIMNVEKCIPARTWRVQKQVMAHSYNHTIRENGLDDTDGLKQRLPGALVIGISKCGTRAILAFLSLHPGVSCGTLEKPLHEIKYFNRNYHKSIEWYRKQMWPSHQGQLTMEKSPGYFIGEDVPERIQKFNKSIKLIVSVCDPIFRYVSQFAQNEDNFRRQGKTYTSINNHVVYPESGQLRNNTELRNGCYSQQMAKWYKLFPSSHIYVADGDALRKDPYPEMLKIESFLGLPKFFKPSHFYFNETKGFYCPVSEGVPICLGHDKGRPHPVLAPKIEQKLRAYYKICNGQFVHLVNKQFDWF